MRQGKGVKVTGSSWKEKPLVLEYPKKPGNKNRVPHGSLYKLLPKALFQQPPEARISIVSLLQVSKLRLWAGTVTAEVPPSVGFELRSHLKNPGLSIILL